MGDVPCCKTKSYIGSTSYGRPIELIVWIRSDHALKVQMQEVESSFSTTLKG